MSWNKCYKTCTRIHFLKFKNDTWTDEIGPGVPAVIIRVQVLISHGKNLSFVIVLAKL